MQKAEVKTENCWPFGEELLNEWWVEVHKQLPTQFFSNNILFIFNLNSES